MTKLTRSNQRSILYSACTANVISLNIVLTVKYVELNALDYNT